MVSVPCGSGSGACRRRGPQSGVELLRIEDAGRVEGSLQARVDRCQRRRLRREHADRLVAVAEQRGVSARACAAARTWAAVSALSSSASHQRCPPPHSTSCAPGRASGAAVPGTAMRHKARPAATGEKGMALFAQCLPQCGRLALGHGLAAELGASRAQRRGARQAHVQRTVVPGRGRDRQRAAAPGIECIEGLLLVEGEAQRGIGEGDRQHLQRDFGIRPNVPSEPASRRETS